MILNIFRSIQQTVCSKHEFPVHFLNNADVLNVKSMASKQEGLSGDMTACLFPSPMRVTTHTLCYSEEALLPPCGSSSTGHITRHLPGFLSKSSCSVLARCKGIQTGNREPRTVLAWAYSVGIRKQFP